MSVLIDVFVAPEKAFAQLRDKPTWALPFFLVCAAAFFFMWLYFTRVDASWYVVHALAQAGRDAAAAKAQAPANTSMMRNAAAVLAMLKPACAGLLYALYLYLAGRTLGKDMSFRRSLSLASWSRLPLLLGLIVAIAGALHMTPRTAYESLRLTYLDPLLLQLPIDSAWSAFAKGLNLLTFWQIGLTAIGWKTLNRSGWAQALLVAALPMAIIWLVRSAMALSAG